MNTHDFTCPCSTCDDAHRQGKCLASVEASASLFGWACLGIVAILVAALVTAS